FKEQMAPLIPAARLTRAVTPERLRLQGESCPALTEDQLCLVHATHGSAAKPRVCQIFPFHFVETPTSVRVGVSFACPGVLDRQGPRLADQRADVEALYASAVAGSSLVMRVPESVALDGRHALAWSDAELLLDDMAAALAQDRPLVERVARAGALPTLVGLALDKGRTFERARAGALAGAQLLTERILSQPALPDSVSRTLLRGVVHSTTFGKGALERVSGVMASLVGKGTLRLRDGTSATFRAAAAVSADLDEASEGLLASWLLATVQ